MKDCINCVNCDFIHGFMCTCHYSYDDKYGHHQIGQDVNRKKADNCDYYTENPYNRDNFFVL